MRRSSSAGGSAPPWRSLPKYRVWIGIALFFLLFASDWSQVKTDSEKDAPQADDSAAPIKPVPGLTGDQRILAQQLVLSSEEVARKVIDSGTGKPLRSAVFGVIPARESDITDISKACRQSTCFRIDIYNYAFNATFRVLADVDHKKVVAISQYLRGQPELPDYLTKRALDIAVNSDKVQSALGFKPEAGSAVMANVQTALNDTQCESSRHLCVAPTFVFTNAEKALWAIVDLTDERVAGIQWTDIGRVNAIRPTEQSIQRENVYDKYCKERQSMSRGRWRFKYIITSSDGLELTDVYYGDEKVLDSVKLVDWHVSYSKRHGFGYSDAIGCPQFSSAAVGALTGPDIEPLDNKENKNSEKGFVMEQDFHHPLWPAPCNYRYTQRFEFYADGRFRITGGQYGRGCGVDGIYRPVLRIKPALGKGAEFSQWDGSEWRPWDSEQWALQNADTQYTAQGYQYRVRDADKGWYLEPGTGQFEYNRGDNAYVYVTRDHPGEGDDDMITIGPCCNDDYRQGPQKFIDDPPEALDGSGFVIWYVPQLSNDSQGAQQYCWAATVVEDGVYKPVSWPCYGGPMFVPTGAGSE